MSYYAILLSCSSVFPSLLRKTWVLRRKWASQGLDWMVLKQKKKVQGVYVNAGTRVLVEKFDLILGLIKD